MYGRGVAVSKSDFATYVFALKALIQSGAIRLGAVEVHLTYDEESGGETDGLLAKPVAEAIGGGEGLLPFFMALFAEQVELFAALGPA